MTTRERTLVEQALEYLHKLPSGIGPGEVDEDDAFPEDTIFYFGSLAARCLIEALEEGK